jgi:two-component system sensor histidine kinase ChvG
MLRHLHREGRGPRLWARILVACVLLVLAPLAVAWVMGLFDAFETHRLAAELAASEEAFTAALEARGLEDPTWLPAFGHTHDAYVRVLDARGARVLATNPADAEGRFSQRWIFRGLADYFFGPGGPPDLASHEAALGPEAERPEVQAVLHGAPSGEARRVTPKMLILYRAVPAPGGGVLYLTRMSRRSVRALYDFRYQLLKLTLGLLLGALVMGIWLAYQVVSPVHALRAQVQAYLRGEAPGPLTLERGDELGDLSRSFEALRARLEARLGHATRVTADFAHDLKSPLAAVRAAGELLEGERPLAPERRARLAQTLASATAHMERSLDALLALARLEAELEEEARAMVDLADVVRVAVAELAEHPRAGQVSLQIEAQGPVMLRLHEARVAQAIRNLVDNALVFAATQVQVALRIEPDAAVVRVSDDGPGISAGNRARIFERFFTHRPEGAPSGTGLGLAIVRTVARAHGGEVVLVEEGGLSGATFELRLPRRRRSRSRGRNPRRPEPQRPHHSAQAP